MRGQRYDLVTESSLNKQNALRKIISYIFSDENIFVDRGFRKLLRKNPRGYVHCNDLMVQPILEEYFHSIEVTDPQQKSLFIRGAVQNCSGQLYYHLDRVRRVVPFNMEKFKKMKPICIERITKPISIEDIRDIFGQHVFALNQKIQKQSSKDDILIYSQNYREKMSYIQSQNPPFSIMDYDEFSKQYDLGDRMRERKMRAVQRPLQMPRRRIQQQEMNHFEDRMEEAHETIRKSHIMYMKNNSEQDYREFNALAREPNVEFNQLLVDMFRSQPMSHQRNLY